MLASRRALAIGLCSLLGGPLFMGGYVAAVLLAGPADALTATATYPVLGAILARPLLRQRLDRVGWLGVVAAAAGATLIAVDAGGSDDGVRTPVGIGLALVAAAAVALEGIVATRAMVGLDTNTVMAARELLSAGCSASSCSWCRARSATVGQIVADAGLAVLIAGAGAIGGYSYVDLVPVDPQDRRRAGDGAQHLLRDVGGALRLDLLHTPARRPSRSPDASW